MFTDREGDPHSPVRPASQPFGRLRGLFQAHIGWFFKHQSTAREKYASDLLADRDLVLIDRLFVPFCVLTLLIPFALGYALGGSWGAAFGALLWAGVLRVALLHHVTWSTNSVCHTFGSRPFRTKDASRNLPPLAVLSMGESWHNAHHAFPNLARHGVDRHQVDSSAMLIRVFERLGWATHVRGRIPARLNARRTATGLRGLDDDPRSRGRMAFTVGRLKWIRHAWQGSGRESGAIICAERVRVPTVPCGSGGAGNGRGRHHAPG